MSKRYRVVIHPDGTRSVRGTERDRVYSWAVVRELPEGATHREYNGYGSGSVFSEVPATRYKAVSWRSDWDSATKYAESMPSEYDGIPAVYTVKPTAECDRQGRISDE